MKIYTTMRRTENAFGNDHCLRQPVVFFRIRRGTFPYGVEDDASTISQPPTTHYTSTCVKLTIVTHLSFSERIAVANLSLCDIYSIRTSMVTCCDYIYIMRGYLHHERHGTASFFAKPEHRKDKDYPLSVFVFVFCVFFSFHGRL